jgi:hypothetical protein
VLGGLGQRAAGRLLRVAQQLAHTVGEVRLRLAEALALTRLVCCGDAVCGVDQLADVGGAGARQPVRGEDGERRLAAAGDVGRGLVLAAGTQLPLQLLSLGDEVFGVDRIQSLEGVVLLPWHRPN